MAVCSGYVTYNAFDAPDTEKTKWAVAAGHALYHLFIVRSATAVVHACNLTLVLQVVKAINGPTWVGPFLPSYGMNYEDFSEEYLRWGSLTIHVLLFVGFVWWIMKTNEKHYPTRRVVGLTQEAIEEEERRRRIDEEAQKLETITTPGAQALSEGSKRRR